MNVANIGQLGGLSALDLANPATGASSGSGFHQVISKVLEDASAQQAQADQAVRELAVGQTDELHRVLLSAAQADLSFRMLLEVRNRVTEALQEVMRMQI